MQWDFSFSADRRVVSQIENRLPELDDVDLITQENIRLPVHIHDDHYTSFEGWRQMRSHGFSKCPICRAKIVLKIPVFAELSVLVEAEQALHG